MCKSNGWKKFGVKWKLCPKCGEYKLRGEEFHSKASAKDGLQSYCKVCLNENSKRDYKANNRKDLFAYRAKASRKECFAIANEIKATNGCCCCDEKDPCCLDFHHLGEKLHLVSELAMAKSKTKMMAEIKKCAVVCANCHRKLHAGKLPTETLQVCKIPDWFL